MRKIIDLKKQSKKAQKAFHAQQRGSWNGLNPITRVVPNGKAYSRAKAKAEARRVTPRYPRFRFCSPMELECNKFSNPGYWLSSSLRTPTFQ